MRLKKNINVLEVTFYCRKISFLFPIIMSLEKCNLLKIVLIKITYCLQIINSKEC